MNPKTWFTEGQQKLKRDPEYITEDIIFDITNKLFVEMKNRKISQKELAKTINVSAAYISKILNGTPNLTIESLVKISIAIGLKPKINLLDINHTPSVLKLAFKANNTASEFTNDYPKSEKRYKCFKGGSDDSFKKSVA